MSRRIVAGAMLTLIYAFTLASLKPADLAMGAVISTVAILSFHRFLFAGESPAGPSVWTRFLNFWPMCAVVLWDVVRGTGDVAGIVLGLRPLKSPGIVEIPIGERSHSGIAVSALALTLSPGEFLVDVHPDRGVFLIHVIDASDPDDIRAKHEHFYQRYQRRTFP